MSGIFSLRSTYRLALLAAFVAASACASTPQRAWRSETTVGVEPAWRKPHERRRQAIDTATLEARHKLWAGLLKEKTGATGPGQPETLGQLAALDPAFASKLRGMIGELRPAAIHDEPGNTLSVTLRIDQNEVQRLTREHLGNLP